MHNNVDALPRVPLRHVAEGPATPARGGGHGVLGC